MKATKRKKLIPANIDAMTDAEHWKWYSSLSDDEMDKVANRTFKGKPEYWFYLEQRSNDVGRELIDTCDTLEDAMKHFNDCKGDSDTIACEVEKTIGHYSVADRDLRDRDYETVIQFGEFSTDGPEK